ncbi:hypothetical protein L195_g046440, partial [Trifolium pratense]
DEVSVSVVTVRGSRRWLKGFVGMNKLKENTAAALAPRAQTPVCVPCSCA